MVVHRLLAACLKLAPLPAKSRDRAALHGLADNLNERHRNAQFAGRASVELHTLIFFQKRTVVADARIIRVRRQVSRLIERHNEVKHSVGMGNNRYNPVSRCAGRHVCMPP